MRRVLIANRGEIAVRIARACRELGMESVAVYSDADRESRHVTLCDASLYIGPSPAKASYLNRGTIIAAARATGCDAVHPGYGFLSEDADFADLCEQNQITFVGPPSTAIRSMGDKIAAKTLAESIGVPLVEGGTIEAGDRSAFGKSLPYPVLLKAAAGGGGRGMRIVTHPEDFAKAYLQAQTEAKEAFGDGTVYWERYIRNARHVEVQVFSDSHGNHVHLGERDCTLQRRHQKLFEESPSAPLSDDIRAKLCESAVQICKTLDYRGAGTVEFLYDMDRRSYHFIEMNTRIQVEHPVTEMVTGVDLVREQMRVARGLRLSPAVANAERTGCAMECRINAEDPELDFRPSPGRIQQFQPSGGPGVRVDTHCAAGSVVSPYYDSMIAKLIVWDIDREHARRRMLRALREFSIEGVATTIPFHIEVLESGNFIESNYSTRSVSEWAKEAVA